MAHRALVHVLAMSICPLAACNGCEDEATPPLVRASRLSPIESKRISTLDRRAAHKIDPAKKLTIDAAGVTQCAEDRDCFVLTAERCAPAVFDHTQVAAMFGLEQHVAARYTIVGEGEGGCEVRRELKSLALVLAPELIAGLHAKGKSDEEIAGLRADAYKQLQDHTPAHLKCSFSSDQLLEAVLDLVEGKSEARLWHEGCTEQKAP